MGWHHSAAPSRKGQLLLRAAKGSNAPAGFRQRGSNWLWALTGQGTGPQQHSPEFGVGRSGPVNQPRPPGPAPATVGPAEAACSPPHSSNRLLFDDVPTGPTGSDACPVTRAELPWGPGARTPASKDSEVADVMRNILPPSPRAPRITLSSPHPSPCTVPEHTKGLAAN